MKILVLGTRGIPDVLGGVETHCQELYPRLVDLGCDIRLITRTPYVAIENRAKSYNGVQLKHIFAPKKKSIEAIVHTFLGVLYARFYCPDILHVHAIGPSLMVPLARLLGLRVVVTHHGPDYDRQKWGVWAKRILKLGEYGAAKFSNQIIVISNVIGKILETKYNRAGTILIHNGVNLAVKDNNCDYIHSLGLVPGNFMIAVGRFVEEKGFHDLINAYKRLNSQDLKLVLVGDADHETVYSSSLKKMAHENGVILTGFIKGSKLQQIFTSAKLFVMPSYHEGLPIALLEAMSYDLPVLVSDIPANLEVELNNSDYFKLGDDDDFVNKLKMKSEQSDLPDYSKKLNKEYNWDIVAKETYKVYKELL
ncbi:MAG: glycosyltransferase family 4 protein [Gammaproteobacteria bacterium]|nr:glycosyltransferase family 4 protein [Gammaproteobacteria bacterium]